MVCRILLLSLTISIILPCCITPDTKTGIKTPLSFRNDAAVNGVYTGNDFSTLTFLWKYKTGGAVRATPLYNNDQIFFGSGDSNFYALEAATGKKVWQFKAGAAIHSSAAIAGNKVYFNDRSNNLYALNVSNGKLSWKTSLGQSLAYDWGFDYYQSSPLVKDNTVYTGSGDGNLYAINADDGKIKWTFKAGSMIRSSPCIAKELLYFGDCNGKIYSLDAGSGKHQWTYSTIGDTLQNDFFGFDRKAIIASPVINDNKCIIGSRDGYLYSLDAVSGKELWKYNFDVSWVISTVAIKDSMVVCGTSDGKIVTCINLDTGKETWRAATSLVWASPVIISNTVLTAQNDGSIYLHDLKTGKEKSRHSIGDRFFSSPVYNNGYIYVGNDDGNMYAFGTAIAGDTKEVKRAVFWVKDPVYSGRKFGIDAFIKDYFINEGYQLLNEEQLASFIRDRVKDTLPSVIIFATNLLPESIIAGPSWTSLFYQYLAKGGKTVMTALNPAIYSIDYKTKEFKGLDYSLAEGIMGLAYPYKDLRSHRGFYSTGLTEEGKTWGLLIAPISHSNVDPQKVQALTLDETGNAGCWVKNYGHKKGTGFVQLWVWPDNLNTGIMKQVKEVAEFGL